MGIDDMCNTGLVLSLGLETPFKIEAQRQAKQGLDIEPSLTLCLSGANRAACDERPPADHLYRQASPHSHNSLSAVSSFSSQRVKRERDLSSEDAEVETLVSSKASDEDDDGANARKKLRLTKEQSALLEESFKQHSTLNPVISLSLLCPRLTERSVPSQRLTIRIPDG